MQMSLGKDFRTMEKAPIEVYFQCDTHITLAALLRIQPRQHQPGQTAGLQKVEVLDGLESAPILLIS